MTFPTTQTVGYSQFVGMTTDSMENDVPQNSAPVDIPVYSWKLQQQPHLGDLSERDGYTGRNNEYATVCLPVRDVNIQDLFYLDGGQPFWLIEVDSPTHGWHGWAPGITLKLQRVTG